MTSSNRQLLLTLTLLIGSCTVAASSAGADVSPKLTAYCSNTMPPHSFATIRPSSSLARSLDDDATWASATVQLAPASLAGIYSAAGPHFGAAAHYVRAAIADQAAHHPTLVTLDLVNATSQDAAAATPFLAPSFTQASNVACAPVFAPGAAILASRHAVSIASSHNRPTIRADLVAALGPWVSMVRLTSVLLAPKTTYLTVAHFSSTYDPHVTACVAFTPKARVEPVLISC